MAAFPAESLNVGPLQLAALAGAWVVNELTPEDPQIVLVEPLFMENLRLCTPALPELTLKLKGGLGETLVQLPPSRLYEEPFQLGVAVPFTVTVTVEFV